MCGRVFNVSPLGTLPIIVAKQFVFGVYVEKVKVLLYK